MATLPAQDQGRPGTRGFAPRAQLVSPEGRPLNIAGQPVSQDIVSAKVTLVHDGVSQLEVVLNNQRHDDRGRAVVPTWRYNKLDVVSFGKRVRLDLCYGDQPWTPMILARITDMSFLFPQAAGSQVTLQGEDLLSLLKIKPNEDQSYRNTDEVSVVERVVQSSQATLPVTAQRLERDFAAKLPVLTHQKSQTYLQFIQELAQRMDYEVYAEFDAVPPAPAGQPAAAPTVRMHFRPSRSATLGEPLVLAWGRDLLDFKPAFKGWDLLTHAVAGGSPPQRRGRFNAEEAMADAINDAHAAAGATVPLLSAAQARERAFDDENRPRTHTETIAVSNLDEERARLQARAVLRRSARQFLTADITTPGMTQLRPGLHVELRNFHAPFDGIYYVTQTVHTLSAAGYLTVSSLRRPGMLDPRHYPGG